MSDQTATTQTTTQPEGAQPEGPIIQKASKPAKAPKPTKPAKATKPESAQPATAKPESKGKGKKAPKPEGEAKEKRTKIGRKKPHKFTPEEVAGDPILAQAQALAQKVLKAKGLHSLIEFKDTESIIIDRDPNRIMIGAKALQKASSEGAPEMKGVELPEPAIGEAGVRIQVLQVLAKLINQKEPAKEFAALVKKF